MGSLKHSPWQSKYDRRGAYHWHWYSKRPRYREFVDWLKVWVVEKNTLEIGAGDGLIVSQLGIRGIDTDRIGIREAQSRGAFVIYGDAHELIFRDEEFESVLFSHTLEHLEFPIKALEEARRVLSKNLYIVVPVYEDDFRTSPKELQAMIESIGFRLIGEVKEYRTVLYAKFKKYNV